MLYPQAERALTAAAGDEPVSAPGFDIDGLPRRRRAPRRPLNRACRWPRCATSTPTGCRAGSTGRRRPTTGVVLHLARRGLRLPRHRRARRPGPPAGQRLRCGGAQRRLPAAARAPLPGRARRRRHRPALAGRRTPSARGARRPSYVHGDSAGGNLALVAALRNPGRFAAVVLTYPFLDPEAAVRRTSWQVSGFDPCRGSAGTGSQYAANAADLTDPDLAPLRSEQLRHAAPDARRHRGVRPAARRGRSCSPPGWRSRGSPSWPRVYLGQLHGFWRHPASSTPPMRSPDRSPASCAVTGPRWASPSGVCKRAPLQCVRWHRRRREPSSHGD